MNPSVEVARMEQDLRDYQIRAENDERLIALLKEQNAKLAHELQMTSFDDAEKIRRLTQERDEALVKATEVSGILNQATIAVMAGLRKMKGDEAPTVIEQPNLVQIGKMKPPIVTYTENDLLPKNEMKS